jgi:glycosyltransferase involved in cell wall biosynthesis
LNVSDKVHFFGWRDDVPAVMARSDIVALVSYSEGLPMVLLEAMCLKKPAVATRVGGIPEVVCDGVDGDSY